MPIPAKIKKILENDERMESCAICGTRNNLEWQHCWIYSGRQVQEAWAIVALCKHHHEECTPHNNKYDERTRYKVELISLGLMTDEDVQKYPKKNWEQEARIAFYELSKYDQV